MQKRSLIALASLALGACAHTSSPGQVRIANALNFDLLPPASFGENLVLTQAATITFGNEQHELLFYTEISAENLAIVGALPNGTRLFSISYDGLSIQSDGNQDLLSSITPEYFLADFQIAQWPFEQVAHSLAVANPCFALKRCEIGESADQLQRNLSRDGETIIKIQYDSVPHYQNSTLYEHVERGYRLQVETLEVQALSEEEP